MKRLVCLANSRKISGRCIAGVEVTRRHKPDVIPIYSELLLPDPLWIRPVSGREHGEVSEYERQYKNGSDPKVLDVMDVHLLTHQPKMYQQEDWLLDPERHWQKIGSIPSENLFPLASYFPDPFWIDGYHTYHGTNDRIPLELAKSLTSSLQCVRVKNLTLSVFAEGKKFGDMKRKIRGRFLNKRNKEYRFRVTDPVYERKYLSKPDGDYNLGESFLTVSLGEPFDGFCYKLIAAIIPLTNRPSV